MSFLELLPIESPYQSGLVHFAIFLLIWQNQHQESFHKSRLQQMVMW